MKLHWNDGSSLADGMGTEWKPEIPEWSWSGMSVLSIIIAAEAVTAQLVDTKNAALSKS